MGTGGGISWQGEGGQGARDGAGNQQYANLWIWSQGVTVNCVVDSELGNYKGVHPNSILRSSQDNPDPGSLEDQH